MSAVDVCYYRLLCTLIVNKIIQDDIVYEDSEDIANMFNDNVVYIGKDVAESIVRNNNSHLDYMAHIK